MKIADILPLIEGSLLTKTASTERDITGCGAADLMSDVLASLQPESMLLTGLCNSQVVRTSLIADVRAIILVRGKAPTQDTIDLADQENIPVICTKLGMFETCGRLFRSGLKCYENPISKSDCNCSQ